MTWSQDIGLDEFKWLVASFLSSYGYGGRAGYLEHATSTYHRAKQFSVNGEYFVTWAYLDCEQEADYATGRKTIFDDITPRVGKRLWLMDAHIGRLQEAKHALSHLSAGDTHCRMVSTHHGRLLKIHKFALMRQFDREIIQSLEWVI